MSNKLQFIELFKLAGLAARAPLQGRNPSPRFEEGAGIIADFRQL
jgi:hypothetical protein